MKAIAFIFVLGNAIFGGYSQLPAQGIVYQTVAFEGPPVIPSGANIGVASYSEAGMAFEPINDGDHLVLAGGGVAHFPENGTQYLLHGLGTSLSGILSSVGDGRFGLYSVDLSEFSILYASPKLIQFVGYRADGSTVVTQFTTDGTMDGASPLADFETFYFPKEFSDIVRFEVPSHTYALDNLVFFVPEPSSTSLVLISAAALFRFRRRRGRESRNDRF